MSDHEDDQEQLTEAWLQSGFENQPRYQTPADRLAMLAQPGTPIYLDGKLVGMRNEAKIEQIKEIEDEHK